MAGSGDTDEFSPPSSPITDWVHTLTPVQSPTLPVPAMSYVPPQTYSRPLDHPMSSISLRNGPQGTPRTIIRDVVKEAAMAEGPPSFEFEGEFSRLSRYGMEETHHQSSGNSIPRMPADVEDLQNVARATWYALDGMRVKEGDKAEAHEARLYSRLLGSWRLTPTQQNQVHKCASKYMTDCPEVPAGSVVPEQPKYEAVEWAKASTIHRMCVLVKNLLTAEETEDITKRLRDGDYNQGVDDIATYYNRMIPVFQLSTVGESEWPALFIRGLNQALPKHKFFEIESTMWHYMDKISSRCTDMNVTFELATAKERELYRIARRAFKKRGMKASYLVDDSNVRQCAFAGFASETALHEYMAQVAGKQVAAAMGKHPKQEYPPESEVEGAMPSNHHHQSRVAAADHHNDHAILSRIEKLEVSSKKQGDQIAKVEVSVTKIEATMTSGFEMVLAEIKKSNSSSGGGGDRSRSTERRPRKPYDSSRNDAARETKECNRCGIFGHFPAECDAPNEDAKAHRGQLNQQPAQHNPNSVCASQLQTGRNDGSQDRNNTETALQCILALVAMMTSSASVANKTTSSMTNPTQLAQLAEKATRGLIEGDHPGVSKDLSHKNGTKATGATPSVDQHSSDSGASQVQQPVPIVKEELTSDLQNVYDKLCHYENQAEAIKNAAEALKSDPAEIMTKPISEAPSKVRILEADQYVIIDNKIPVLNPDAIQEKRDHQTEQAAGECVMDVGDDDEHHDIDPWILPHVRSEFDP